MLGSTAREQALLHPDERHRQVGTDGGAEDPARVGTQTRGNVHGNNTALARVDGSDGRLKLVAYVSRQPGP